jgi:hypothetical protein
MKNRKEIMEEIGGLLERAEYGALVFVAAFLREAGTFSPTGCAGAPSRRGPDLRGTEDGLARTLRWVSERQ